jgi:hypothetical protein
MLIEVQLCEDAVKARGGSFLHSEIVKEMRVGL